MLCTTRHRVIVFPLTTAYIHSNHYFQMHKYKKTNSVLSGRQMKEVSWKTMSRAIFYHDLNNCLVFSTSPEISTSGYRYPPPAEIRRQSFRKYLTVWFQVISSTSLPYTFTYMKRIFSDQMSEVIYYTHQPVLYLGPGVGGVIPKWCGMKFIEKENNPPNASKSFHSDRIKLKLFLISTRTFSKHL